MFASNTYSQTNQVELTLSFLTERFSSRKPLGLFFEKEASPYDQRKINTALYEKMFAAQENYRARLLSQPPKEVLNHAYEYIHREDILLSLECRDLSTPQAKALLRSTDPLNDIFTAWEKRESSYMDELWDTIESRANAVMRLQLRTEPDR